MEGVVVLKHCMQEQVSFTVTVAKERFKQKKNYFELCHWTGDILRITQAPKLKQEISLNLTITYKEIETIIQKMSSKQKPTYG